MTLDDRQRIWLYRRSQKTMRYTLRSVAFVLTLTSGIVIWYALAYRSVASVAPVQANVAAARQTSTPQPKPTPAAKLIRFGPVEPLFGFTNTEIVALRRKPDAKASIFAKVELPLTAPVEI